MRFREQISFKAPDAIKEASRCLMCEEAPCSKGCPAGIDVMGFIRKIRFEDFKGAIDLIREKNVFPGTCGLVCPVEELCEKNCSSTRINFPIQINKLQYFSYEQDPFNVKRLPKAKRNGLKVAVVGGGPAGLTCAFHLNQKGYEVHVIEQNATPGGVPATFLPEDRLPSYVIANEVKNICDCGFFVVSKALDLKNNLEKLTKKFDAVFLSFGLHGKTRMGIPGENLNGILDSSEFLTMFRKRDKSLHPVDSAAVIGGGNVAMDAIWGAKKLGCRDVFLLYRRSLSEMPAWRTEIEGIFQMADVHPLFLVQPVAYLGTKGKVSGVECARMMPGEPDKSGRRSPKAVPGSNFILPVQLVLEAIGLRIDPLLERTLKPVKITDGAVKINKKFMTSVKGVFAGGDIVRGGDTVVRAVRDGTDAAKAIDEFLSSGGK